MRVLMRLSLAVLYLGLTVSMLKAQETYPVNGVQDEREGLYAFTNATLFTKYNQKIEKATLLIRDGKIEAAGANVTVPSYAIVYDLKGKYVYPAFIDLYSSYGTPEIRRDAAGGGRGFNRTQQFETDKPGAYAWNKALKPEFRAYENFTVSAKDAKGERDLGFGAVLTHQMDGICRGTSAVVLLGEEKEHEMIVSEEVAQHFSFNKGTSRQSYPTSLMGAIALLRQTYYDGQWYKNQHEEVNLSLEAWNKNLGLKQVFEVRDWQEALRAAKIGKEFGVTYIIKGDGDEYQRLDEVKATGSSFIIPVNFPDAFDVEDPFAAQSVTLAQMKHWELAPTNAGRLAKAGVNFALTADGLRRPADFYGNVRKAIAQGLTEEQALRALTETPAKMAGVEAELGSLEKGKLANFFITSGPVFDEKSQIYHVWVKGKPFILKDIDAPDLAGQYTLTVGSTAYKLNVTGTPEKPDMKIVVSDTSSITVKQTMKNGALTLSFEPEKGKGLVRLSGTGEKGKWSGRGQDPSGAWLDWNAVRQGDAAPANADKAPGERRGKPQGGGEKKEEGAMAKVTYPFIAFGRETLPQAGTYLIKNGTVWTNEADGILQNADVLIRDGKIAQVGKNLSAAGATVIDATGKHITSGVIDEHSHIAASRGINEGAQASSAEVRIGDVINTEDINIYRQLAGGVTASQILHGSANPIGGQSGLIKLRWGYAPEKMKIEGADGFIKFALGENVKQSSFDASTRYPRTRMGVEQVFDDMFTRAEEYATLKKSGKSYRRDLELDALQEVVESKRFVTCHSYQQGEINMMMKVAEKHHFHVNTFTHILEGYKVADKMAKHGAGGSTFSDWWAYKFEVIEAIPYNGALMNAQGVTVAFNSDDAEMARRLNQEAGKAVIFGGVPEEEAWKFVTLNPAKLLHLDKRMGSLKPGKDADVVIWSDNPLSVYAKAEKTFVDGIKFFDREEDAQMQKEVASERNRLIQKMLAAKQGGEGTQAPRGRRFNTEYTCDDLDDEISEN